MHGSSQIAACGDLSSQTGQSGHYNTQSGHYNTQFNTTLKPPGVFNVVHTCCTLFSSCVFLEPMFRRASDTMERL